MAVSSTTNGEFWREVSQHHTCHMLKRRLARRFHMPFTVRVGHTQIPPLTELPGHLWRNVEVAAVGERCWQCRRCNRRSKQCADRERGRPLLRKILPHGHARSIDLQQQAKPAGTDFTSCLQLKEGVLPFLLQQNIANPYCLVGAELSRIS